MASQPGPELPDDARAGRRLLVLAVAIAVGFGLWVRAMGATLDPTARDQVHDMALAIRIREGTSLSDGNRHPLFPALLAPVASRDPSFFPAALAVNAVLAAAAVFGIFAATRRVYGPALAIAATLGVLLEVRLQARRICPEPLFAALLVGAAAALARAPVARRPALAAAVAGGWLGLAWLAKGSATLALAAAVWTALRLRGGARWRDVAVLVAGFLVAGAPLACWNVAHGHAPLWNVNSAHVMWEERWDVDLDQRSDATPASWGAAHGAGDAVARLVGGLGTQRGVEWIAGFLAVAALGAVHAAWRRRASRRTASPSPAPAAVEPHRTWMRFACATAILWGAAMAWYAPIVASRRLLFPVFPVLLPPALAILATVFRSAVAPLRRWAVALAPWGAVGVVAAGGAALVFADLGRTPRGLGADAVTAVAALRRLPAGARVVVRPSRTHPPDWLVEGQVVFLGLPGSVPDAEAPAWLAAHADAVLLNEGLLRNRPGAFPGFAIVDRGTGPPVIAATAGVPPWPVGVYTLIPTRDERKPR